MWCTIGPPAVVRLQGMSLFFFEHKSLSCIPSQNMVHNVYFKKKQINIGRNTCRHSLLIFFQQKHFHMIHIRMNETSIYSVTPWAGASSFCVLDACQNALRCDNRRRSKCIWLDRWAFTQSTNKTSHLFRQNQVRTNWTGLTWCWTFKTVMWNSNNNNKKHRTSAYLNLDELTFREKVFL